MLAFYKALFGAVEISRVSEDGPAFYVGLQIGNAELGVVADEDAHIDATQRILLNVNEIFHIGHDGHPEFRPRMHDTGDTAGPAVPMEYLAGSFLGIQSLPDKAA